MHFLEEPHQHLLSRSIFSAYQYYVYDKNVIIAELASILTQRQGWRAITIVRCVCKIYEASVLGPHFAVKATLPGGYD